MFIGSYERDRGEAHLHRRKVEMDKELSEIWVDMEKLAFKMQQEEKVH
jgi:hypothetical protein